jgi:hypothetical protein
MAGKQDVKAKAKKRGRREGPRRSLNLSITVDHHRRIWGLAILLDRDPSELVMAWIEEKTSGMRFSLPGQDQDGEGASPERGRGGEREVPAVLPCRREAI